MQTSKFLFIIATAVTLGQGHRNVIQYIFPDPYFLCPKYLSLAQMVLMWEAKVIVADADMDADADADVVADSKHKVTLDWGDLMMFLLLCFLIFSYYAYQTYLCFIWKQHY